MCSVRCNGGLSQGEGIGGRRSRVSTHGAVAGRHAVGQELLLDRCLRSLRDNSQAVCIFIRYFEE